MIAMTLAEIATVVGGTVAGADPSVMVTGPAFVDSRIAERGGLFVAVVGERVDGHDYADAAVDAGAAAVLSTRDTGHPGVLVDDAVTALAALAHHVLGRLDAVRVVALTGSQGKTSTKDLLAQVLAAAGRTVATYGSFNNELGLPLTVLRADTATRYLVLEMGARHIGDLRYSCEIAQPEVSLVLNVGKAHIGEFGSQEGIAQAKGEIVDALGADGTAVLNADDPLVAGMRPRSRGRVLTFGEHADADVRFSDVRVDDLGRPTFRLAHSGEQEEVAMGLVGEHHAGNAAAAAGAAVALGVPLHLVAEALRSATATSPGRMEVHERADGVTVIDDAYNANPDSMRAALKALAAIGRGRPGSRTLAVLGEMRELGGRPARSTTRLADWRCAWTSTSCSWSGRRRSRSTWVPLSRAPGVASRSSSPTRTRRSGGCAASSSPATWCCSRRPTRSRLEQRGLRAVLTTDVRRAVDEGHPARRRPVADLHADRHPLRHPGADLQGLRPADPRRRPDDPPHQARHPHDGRAGDHPLGGRRLLPGQARHPGRAVVRRRCCCCSCWWGWARSASSTTTSRSPSSAASACAARRSSPARRSSRWCSAPRADHAGRPRPDTGLAALLVHPRLRQPHAAGRRAWCC